MELRCKSDGCKSSNIYGPHDQRYLCLDCQRIYVTPDVPVRELRIPSRASAKLRLALETRPECLGNHDSACEICTKFCVVIDQCRTRSAPTASDFYSHSASATEEQTITCPTCGELDQGRYCSFCGNLLQKKKRDRVFPARVLHEALINDWLAYGRTIATLLTSPRTFFSAVFSAQSSVYHADQGTLAPARFFLRHIALVGVLTILIDLFRDPDHLELEIAGPMDRLQDLLLMAVVDVLLHLAWIYVPAVLLLITLALPVADRSWPKRANLTADSTYGRLDNLLVALSYLMVLELPTLPGLLWFSSSEFDITASSATPFLLLSVVTKIVVYLWILPHALKFGCRVSEVTARMAALRVYLLPFFLLALLGLVRTCVSPI